MYDVIIVGARVAGSATALLLARRGLSVLVLDRATFPSDTLSTHQVQVPAVARLARWGVLDQILAAGTPSTRSARFDQGEAVITGRFPAYDGTDFMCSPRRTLLDKVLVDAARTAGAEVRENFTVDELVADNGTVTGVRGREKGAPAVTEQARLVIGADGKHSRVAEVVQARAYRTKPPQSLAFYTYWEAVPVSGGAMYGRPGCALVDRDRIPLAPGSPSPRCRADWPGGRGGGRVPAGAAGVAAPAIPRYPAASPRSAASSCRARTMTLATRRS